MKKSIKLIKDINENDAREINLFIDRKSVGVLKIQRNLTGQKA
jgi:hypothetical protein